jgi:eukaryotic-like serine/threonine-protein kinase
MPDLIGQTLKNRYQVQSSLGRGGMADVYLAWDGRRQVLVALKVLREDLSEDPEFLQRFQREAEALARLDHPNIVRFYSLERQGQLAFIVMDYVPGTTLRGRLAAGQPMPPGEVTTVMRQVAEALHYANDSGYVHRDIKPGNIMLREDGTALLSDFGIARAAQAATMTSAPLGTPAYMSPEQILGRDLGPQADIYSLGVCLYEMVTGRRPFTGEGATGTSTMEKVRTQHLHAVPPDPRLYNPNLPPAAVAVILRALAKDPAQRWPDAVSMARAWEAAVRGQPGGYGGQPALSQAGPGVAAPQPTPARSAAAPALSTPTGGQAKPERQAGPWPVAGGAFAIVLVVGLGSALAYQSLRKSSASVQATASAIAQTSVAMQAQATALALQWSTATAGAGATAGTPAAPATSTAEAPQQSDGAATAEVDSVATAVQATLAAGGAEKQTVVAQEAATTEARDQAAKATADAEATAKSEGEAAGKATSDALAQEQSATTEAAAALAKQQTVEAEAAANRAPGLVVSFENDVSWRRGDQPYGDLANSAEQAHGGSYSGRLDYAFPAGGDGFVVFTARPPVAIDGKPAGLSAWVYGDGSGHFLNAWVLDSSGELRQYTFGQIKHTGWAQMFAPFDDKAGWPNVHIDGPDSGSLDYPVSFYGLVLDSVPHGQASQGTIYIDDIFATN